ncbi:MAG: GNAT family N-acetyltransferase [Ruminococcaceae bacterium]|nr:GNAT family N-acetyltransferase [Oscillospiraceae bacterium]
MEIRFAKEEDLDGINSLLYQVLEVHHKGRPDLFFGGVKKYTDDEILAILKNEETPVFVAAEDGKVLGYAFCIFTEVKGSHILKDVKTLYLDDLCVDEHSRGKHVGKALYEHVLSFARESGCYNLTLNVWSCNESAMGFYEKMGLVPQKTVLEKIL